MKSRSGGSRETDEVVVEEVDIEEEVLNDDEMELQTLLEEFVTNKKRGFKKSNDTSNKTLPKNALNRKNDTKKEATYQHQDRSSSSGRFCHYFNNKNGNCRWGEKFSH